MQIRTLGRKLKTLDSAIISDILLWLALFFLALGAAYFFLITLPNRQGQQITLQFKDASAIIPGSPVHMMGLEVGHVSDLKIKDDHVDVTIVTDPDTPKIPPGTVFTILFTGLGGSESIEAILPTGSVESQPASALPSRFTPSGTFPVTEPVRMRQVLDVTLKQVKALQQGSENITEFFGKKRSVEELQFNVHQAHQWSQDSRQFFDDITRNERQVRRDLETNTKGGMATVEGINRQLARVNAMTEPRQLRANLKRFTDLREKTILCQSFYCMTAAGSPLPFSKSRVRTLKKQARDSVKLLDQWDFQQQGVLDQLTGANHWLDAHPMEPILQDGRKTLQHFNTTVYPSLEQELDKRLQKARK